MRKMIQEIGDYQTFVEVEEIPTLEDKVMVRFLTQWLCSKNPDALQVKHSMILSSEERQRLKELL